MMRNSVAVIIAGGKSSRMQTDKALLPFGGDSSLAQYQYKRLSQLFSKVYISAKTNKFDFEVAVIEDIITQTSSPLVALISIFETLTVESVFILSVDAPFVNEEVIKKLYEAKEDRYDGIIATSPNGLEPLCGIYQRGFLKESKKALANNEHRLQALLNQLTIKHVYFDKLEYFINLNYPKEYREAEALIKN